MPLNTSRRSCSRCGASSLISVRYGATKSHSSSVTSLGYGFLAIPALPKDHRESSEHALGPASRDDSAWPRGRVPHSGTYERIGGMGAKRPARRDLPEGWGEVLLGGEKDFAEGGSVGGGEVGEVLARVLAGQDL